MAANAGVTWNLDSYFPEFNGPRMRAFKSKLLKDIDKLKRQATILKTLSADNVRRWEGVLVDAEDAHSRMGHLFSYVGCLEAAHAQVEEYAVEMADLARYQAAFEKFEIDVLNALKKARKSDFRSLCAQPRLKEVAYHLKRLRRRARQSMSRKEEILTADLSVDGLSAWGRLYDKVSGKLEFEFVDPKGRVEQRPISQWRSMMSDPDRERGRKAFESGNRAWQKIEDVCAAALNAIAGTRLTLNNHRRIRHVMDRALFQAGIRRQTLDAMYQVVFNRLDLAREILRTKARFFSRKGVWFFEREAPLPLSASPAFDWKRATQSIHDAFTAAYPALAGYFQDMIRNRWIESETRPGKRPGAFCTGSSWIEEQRVFMTFNGTLGNVTTLAHETGHAWHGHLMCNVRPFARRYPMTLAETASIFAEHILLEGLRNDPVLSDQQRLLLLDNELTDAAVFLLDITTRYVFETAFYEERLTGEVPVSRLKSLMTETQKKIYGDVLLDDGADPYFWASKLHFYMSDTIFYNFPYTFGYLLARALIHRYSQEGKSFLPQYESFLKMSGSDTVENVAQSALGIDLSEPTFWESALVSLVEPLRHYRLAIDRMMAGKG